MLLSTAAQRRGGFPSWLGNWYGNAISSPPPTDGGGSTQSGSSKVPGNLDDVDTTTPTDTKEGEGRTIDWIGVRLGKEVASQGTEIRDADGRKLLGKVGALGNGRCWIVRGRQWTEVGHFPVWIWVPVNSADGGVT
jgi:hypothetical protein